MARQGIRQKWSRLAGSILMLGLLALAPAVGAIEVHAFGNGIRATIYPADDLLVAAKAAGPGVLEIVTPNGAVSVAGDLPTLTPMAQEHVASALAAMGGFTSRVDVNVYLLPATPVDAGGSFARQDGIYLAPGSGPVAEVTAAYIATHEMGHVLTWAFLDGHPSRWDAYLALRGLDRATSGPAASHADRAREILAEDIRYLFGGAAATASRSIENSDLVLPDRVAGLEQMLAGFLAGRDTGPVVPHATAYPNPCNPLTTIAMVVPGSVGDAAQALLRVYDIRGALVRTVNGGNLANGRITIQWNGASDAGKAVASGRYLYVLRFDGLVARGNVTLVR